MTVAGEAAAAGRLVAGRYRLVRPLAAGGMSRVWLATDEARRRTVAIKQGDLPGGLTPAQQDLVREWTLRDARASARVRHRAVIRTLDVVPDTDQPWTVMEYLPCRSLQQVIDESGPLPPARVAEIGLAVLDGLAAIGRAGLVHLDVKPGNVLIADDGRVVLSDFGPVVTQAGIKALADAGIILGSPNYVAPERLFDGVSTARSDLWSLGATLYHAVEGRPPFLRRTVTETLEALVDGMPEPARRAGPLAGVLAGLLQRDPAARLTAAETADRLGRLTTDRPPAVAGVPDRPLRRRTAVLAAVVIAAAGLGAAAAGTRREEDLAAPAGTPAPRAPSPTVPRPPRGFVWWHDPAGFRVAVPRAWIRDPDARDGLLITAPAGRPSLRISAWTPPPADVVTGLIAAERAVVLAEYRRIRIEAPEPPDAVWEYTYADPAGPTRVLERVVSGGGSTYRIQWRAPRPAWADSLSTMGVVLDSFAPLPGA
jgi:hypothetical protein